MKSEKLKMKIIYNTIIPIKGYKAVNILGVLFARKGARLTEEDIRHEEIHTAQMKETLYVIFYLWYAVEWIIRVIANGFKPHDAYRALLFEQEAYRHQGEEGYLEKRELWSFIKHM